MCAQQSDPAKYTLEEQSGQSTQAGVSCSGCHVRFRRVVLFLAPSFLETKGAPSPRTLEGNSTCCENIAPVAFEFIECQDKVIFCTKSTASLPHSMPRCRRCHRDYSDAPSCDARADPSDTWRRRQASFWEERPQAGDGYRNRRGSGWGIWPKPPGPPAQG